jgi:thiamine kinase-like enzyme
MHTRWIDATIPEDNRAAVRHALRKAFDVEDFDEEPRQLAGGLTQAPVFCIKVNRNPYVLKVISGDTSAHYACIRIVSDAGIAPRLFHADPADRVLITDFIEAKPFPDDISARMASTIRRLHSLPLFASQRSSFLDLTAGDVDCFRASELLPESIAWEFFSGYQQLAQVYPCNNSDWIVSHHDLKPQNILYDGDKVWLVDWDQASVDDRYNDLAVGANFFVEDEVAEHGYLQEYFGEPAGEYRSCRFYLMRQLVHVANASHFMVSAANKGWMVGPDFQGSDYRDLHQRLIKNEADLNHPDVQLEYAKVHLHRALCNMRMPRYAEALARVAAGP